MTHSLAGSRRGELSTRVPAGTGIVAAGAATAMRGFIDWNRRASRWQRSLMARAVPDCANDGAREFKQRVLPSLLRPGLRILDVGGGKHPAIPVETKRALGLSIVGLDISEAELRQAPEGAYDQIVVGDVAQVSIPGRYDLILSRSVIEHVGDPRGMMANLAARLAPGGMMAHFMPCRNAPFAILNRWLGNRVSRLLLFTLIPEKRKNSGFLAYYRYCTPTSLGQVCRECGLEVVRVVPYYRSEYTAFFAPLYTLEMLRQALMCSLRLENHAESFSVLARLPNVPSYPVDRFAGLGSAGAVAR